MTKRKVPKGRILREFPKPIVRRPTVNGLGRMVEDERVAGEELAQMYEIAKSYRIPLTFDSDMWFKLACALAFDLNVIRCVEKKSVGKPKDKATNRTPFRILFAVDAVIYKTPNMSCSVIQACQLLSKQPGEWHGLEPKTLRRKYFASRKLMCDTMNESAKKEAVQTA